MLNADKEATSRLRATRPRRDVENDELEAILANLFRRMQRLGETGYSVALVREHLLQLKLCFFFMIDDENIQTLLIGHFGSHYFSIRLRTAAPPRRLHSSNRAGKRSVSLDASCARLADGIGVLPDSH
jgi:DNA polymerase/3'-5' exonuclease PolX